MKRSEIVGAARSWAGVPWRHQGRTRSGIDCVGLVLRVAETVGLDVSGVDIPDYGREPDGRLFGLFARNLTRITQEHARPGSVIVFARGTSACHAGIVLDDVGLYLHASVLSAKVTFGSLRKPLKSYRAIAAFDFPGVIDG
ncbi:MAG: NlpC/P60 family protein [Pseudomonadota bacterium]